MTIVQDSVAGCLGSGCCSFDAGRRGVCVCVSVWCESVFLSTLFISVTALSPLPSLQVALSCGGARRASEAEHVSWEQSSSAAAHLKHTHTHTHAHTHTRTHTLTHIHTHSHRFPREWRHG